MKYWKETNDVTHERAAERLASDGMSSVCWPLALLHSVADRIKPIVVLLKIFTWEERAVSVYYSRSARIALVADSYWKLLETNLLTSRLSYFCIDDDGSTTGRSIVAVKDNSDIYVPVSLASSLVVFGVEESSTSSWRGG